MITVLQRGIIILCVMLYTFPMKAAHIPFTPQDVRILLNVLKKATKNTKTALSDITADKAQVRIVFQSKGIKQTILVTAIVKDQTCKGIDYEDLCITNNGIQHDNKLIKLAAWALRQLPPKTSELLGKVKTCLAQNQAIQARKLLTNLNTDTLDAVEQSEAAMLWLRLKDKDKWTALCKRAMKMTDRLEKRPLSRLRMIAGCADPDMAVNAYKALPSSLKKNRQCIVTDIIEILNERGYKRRSLQLLQSSIPLMSGCKALFWEGISITAKQDCKFMDMLISNNGNIKWKPKWLNLAEQAYQRCGQPAKAALLLLKHGGCGPSTISDLIMLTGRLKDAEPLSKGLQGVKKNPDCPEKQVVQAVLYMKAGRFASALDVLKPAINKKTVSEWPVLLRAMAMYGTGRISKAKSLLAQHVFHNNETESIGKSLLYAVQTGAAWEDNILGIKIGVMNIYSRRIIRLGLLSGVLLMIIWLWWTRP